MLTLSLAATLLLSGCGGDPMAADAEAYHAQLTPALVRNMELAQQFLDIAARVKKEEMPADEILQRWENRVIPLADALKTEAGAIEPSTPELQTLHAELVGSWNARADAYRAMHKAYRGNDAEAFKLAAETNTQSKIAEEAFFRKANAALDPYGFHLDQFPQ